MSDLPRAGSHIHLIAVCGVGMASLAGLLQARGYRVTGSDQNIYPPMSTYLAEIGIEVLSGYRPEHVSNRPDLVVVGNAISRNNPEAQAVLGQNIPYISFPQALGRFLIGARTSLVIAGTHGKTTTTALAAWVLTRAGLDPGFFIGGVPLNFDSGWKVGTGDHIVIEGDEYDTAFFDKGPKFLHYRPRHVILTGVEFDHADIYRDLDHVKTAFGRLVDIIPADGSLVVCADYPAALEISSGARCGSVTYGDCGDWTAGDIRFDQGRTFFEPCYRGKSEGRVEVSLIGRHNLKNALSVYAMGRTIGFEREQLLDGFRTFCGVKRRQETRGEQRGVLVIDDFAHHPTAVRRRSKESRQPIKDGGSGPSSSRAATPANETYSRKSLPARWRWPIRSSSQTSISRKRFPRMSGFPSKTSRARSISLSLSRTLGSLRARPKSRLTWRARPVRAISF
jgi:UDP-N-acetylmuramate: L-alanyl-gamma-D-glutamyl-meso-diaminopimelate ligase